MKRLAVALLCVLSVGGCGWMGWLGRDKPAQVPVAGQGDAAKSSSVLSLGAGQSEAKASPAPQTRPAPYEGYELVGGPKVVDAVALVVNGRSISVNDVLSPLRRQLKSIGASGELSAFVDAAKRIIKDELLRQVGMELVLAEAERILTDQEKDYLKQEVESRVHEMVVESGGSKTKLVESLAAEGDSLEELTKVLGRQMISRYYLQKKFLPQLGATRLQIWEYYQSHKDEFCSPKMVKMQILVFPFEAFVSAVSTKNPTPVQMAVAKAAEARKRIIGGEDFTAVVKDMAVSEAYQSGQAGIYDYMPAGSLREEKVEAVAFAGNVGQVSDVIEGEKGAFIVKTLDIKPENITPFQQAQREIDDKIRDVQYRKLTSEYLQELHKKAMIMESEAFQELLLTRAVQMYHMQK